MEVQIRSFEIKDTQAILDFNAFVQADNRVENVLFPIRDGLLIARKK